MKQNEEGITLVALVVMIIIIIILAGVTMYELSSKALVDEMKNDINYQYNASIEESTKLNSALTNQLNDWGL